MNPPEAVIEDKVMGWLRFYLIEHKSKTLVWQVLTHPGEQQLGFVKWFAGWRKYAFFPDKGTLYEPDCLNDLATFCRMVTTMHRAGPMKLAEGAT